MLIPEQSFSALLAFAAVLVLLVAGLYRITHPNVQEGLAAQPKASVTPSCPTSANVLPFQNAGNVASLQNQVTILQNSTTKAVSSYDTLETTTEALGKRLTKAEQELEQLQASIKQNAKLQNDKVKAAQDKLNNFSTKN